jgi:hypothetical protein
MHGKRGYTSTVDYVSHSGTVNQIKQQVKANKGNNVSDTPKRDICPVVKL